MAKFLVHEHHASKSHWDFRLELDGILKPWAVPKGPTLDVRERRLAVRMPDHDLDYVDFEHIRPVGDGGAGSVLVWDRGSYEAIDPAGAAEGLRRGELMFRLHGCILRGVFALVRVTRWKGSENWIFLKKKEGEAISGWWARIQRAIAARRL